MVAFLAGRRWLASGILGCTVMFACGKAVNTATPNPVSLGGSGGYDDSTLAGAGNSALTDGGSSTVADAGGSAMLPASDWPHCPGVEPISLASAVTGGSLAVVVDEDAVYFSGPGGMISRVSKNGGDVLALQRADSVAQLAVDANDVYIGGYGLWSVPKLGGEPTLVLEDTVRGVVSVNAGLYLTDWGKSRTSLQRWSSEGGLEQIELFDSELDAPFLLADADYIYVTPMATSPAQEVHRVRLSDGTIEPLTAAEIVQGLALGGGNLYFSEQATRSVKRVRLSDRVTETVISFDDYPTGLAVDADYVYVSLQVLPPGLHTYTGHLLRFRTDGSDLCELAAPAGFGTSLVVDETGVYWIGGGTLWKIAR